MPVIQITLLPMIVTQTFTEAGSQQGRHPHFESGSHHHHHHYNHHNHHHHHQIKWLTRLPSWKVPQRRRATSTGSAPAPLLLHGADDVQRPGFSNQLFIIVNVQSCIFNEDEAGIVELIYLFHSMTVLKHPTWDIQGGLGMNSGITCFFLYEVRETQKYFSPLIKVIVRDLRFKAKEGTCVEHVWTFGERLFMLNDSAKKICQRGCSHTLVDE